jgi:hypothetical protein
MGSHQAQPEQLDERNIRRDRPMNILISILTAPFRAVIGFFDMIQEAKRLQAVMHDRWERGL